MNSEAAFQRRVLRLLRQVGDAHKHVDASGGVPDMSFTLRPSYLTRLIQPSLSGWVELKEGAGEWPSKEQGLWMRRRGRAGAAVYLMRQEGRTVGLWWWETALARGPADVRWPGYPTAEELAATLRKLVKPL